MPLAESPPQGSAAHRARRPGDAGFALAPPLPKQPRGMGLREEDPEGERQMKIIGRAIQLIVGAALFAAAIYMVLAVPGLMSDRDSTVPNRLVLESPQ